MKDKILKQIIAVQRDGRVNMLDARGVQVIANELEFYELVVYIEEHLREYAHFIFTGELEGCDDE
jgi:hypothetical protein